jgi:hypothetical protein
MHKYHKSQSHNKRKKKERNISPEKTLKIAMVMAMVVA